MSSRRIILLSLLGIAVVALAARTARRGFRHPVAAADRSAVARRVAGCYELALGPDWRSWLRPFGRGGAHEYNAPPRAVELRLAPAEPFGRPITAGPGGPFKLIPARGASSTRHRLNDWEVDSLSGRVVLRFSTGFSGVALSLTPVSDSALVGEAREFWDFTAVAAHAPARAARAPCARDGGLDRASHRPAA
jgi:hypothetical protein